MWNNRDRIRRVNVLGDQKPESRAKRRDAMKIGKQTLSALALVVALGLVVPTSFGGPASADISRPERIQPMTAVCEGLGELDVTSADKEFHNHHTVGFQVFKLATLQDINSSLVLKPLSGTMETIYTAIDHDADSDTNPEEIGPPADLPPGYPASFAIPPDHPYSGFPVGGFSLGNQTNKKDLVDCVVTDIGTSDEGLQNWFPAGSSDVNGAIPCDRSDGGDPTKCFVEGVTYHYTDIFTIKAQVSGNGDASLKAASVDDDQSADRQQNSKSKAKHKKGGKHRK